MKLSKGLNYDQLSFNRLLLLSQVMNGSSNYSHHDASRRVDLTTTTHFYFLPKFSGFTFRNRNNGARYGWQKPKIHIRNNFAMHKSTIFALVLKMQKDGGRDPDSGFPESSGFLS